MRELYKNQIHLGFLWEVEILLRVNIESVNIFYKNKSNKELLIFILEMPLSNLELIWLEDKFTTKCVKFGYIIYQTV